MRRIAAAAAARNINSRDWREIHSGIMVLLLLLILLLLPNRFMFVSVPIHTIIGRKTRLIADLIHHSARINRTSFVLYFRLADAMRSIWPQY